MATTSPSTVSPPPKRIFCYVLLRKDGSGRAARLIWYDHAPDATLLPAATDGELIVLTESQYGDWVANMTTRAWIGGRILVVATDAVWLVPTATIVQRLAAVGKLRAARVAMKFDAPLDQLTDQELELQELWRSNSSLYSTNPGARAMLDSLSLADVGTSTDAIMAP